MAPRITTMSSQEGGQRVADVGQVRATHEWTRIEFRKKFESNPIVMASVQTYEGGNPVDVRLRNLTPTSVEVKLEEERSADAEVEHVEEIVGYVAFPFFDPHFEADTSGAVITTAGPVDASDWRTYNFFPDYNPEWPGSEDTEAAEIADVFEYKEPIVFAELQTQNGTQPAHIRLRNVGDLECEFTIEEWDYLDGTHVPERYGFVVTTNTVGWMGAAHAGNYYVGTTTVDHDWTSVSIDDHLRESDYLDLGGTWDSYAEGSDAVVFSQCQTYNGADPVVTRHRNVTPNGFEVRLQEAEGSNVSHVEEEVGFMLVSFAKRRDADEDDSLEAIEEHVENRHQSIDSGEELDEMFEDLSEGDG